MIKPDWIDHTKIIYLIGVSGMHPTWVAFLILFLYVCAALKGPFPLWKSYFRIWNELIKNKDHALGRRPRLRLALVLIRVGLTSPIYNILWCVDEILYPDYSSCKLEDPIFIVGPPRCGTTFLQRIMADDEEQFLGIRHIEWRFPFICVQKLLQSTGLKSKISVLSYWPSNDIGNVAQRMHNHSLGDYEEDGIFFEERFLYHYFIFRRFPYPDLVEFIHDSSKFRSATERMIKVHEKVICKINYLANGSKRFIVLKENESMDLLAVMANRYPKSTFIILTRKSQDFLSSYVALSRVSTQCKTGIDPMTIPSWYSCNVWKRHQECELQLDFFSNVLPESRQIRLSFYKLFDELLPTISLIYHHLGVPMSLACLNRLVAITAEQKERQRGYEIEIQNSSEFDRYDQFADEVHQQHTKNLRRFSEIAP